MVLLIADKYPAASQEALRRLGIEVIARPALGAADLPGALAETGAAILVVRSTKVTAEALGASPSLALVIRAGAGVNTIDLGAASARGIFVANCPGKNAIAVAELAMGLLLSLDRRIPEAVGELGAGHWNKKRYGQGRGLYGRRLGLVGFGSIAREVARRALAFGMKVSAWSRSLDDATAEAHGVERADSLAAILEGSDAISIHVPYSEATHHLIGAPELARMRPGALLVHTARGGVVDDVALREAVGAGRIRAGLDVYEGEPGDPVGDFDSPLCAEGGAYGTPHIGASTEQAEEAIAEEVVRIVRDFIHLGSVPNAVNVATDRPAGWVVQVRHLDRVGVLAGVLGALREERLNVQEMQNVIFDGDAAASATITLEREPSEALLSTLRAQEAILAVEVRALS